MRKFRIRDVETVRTTAALYGCDACPCAPWCYGTPEQQALCPNAPPPNQDLNLS